jgi:molecular chaperone GrpE
MFSPSQHEAVFQLPDPEKEPGTVGAVVKRGYVLHGRTLRAAAVGVVKKP